MMFWRTPPSLDKRRANLKDMPDKTFVFFEWASVLTKALSCAEITALHYTKARNSSRIQPAKCSRKISDLRENETSKFARKQQRELYAVSACRAQPEASDLRENETFKFARNRQRELYEGSTRRAKPETSDLRENGTSKFAQNQQRELWPASSWSAC